MSFLARAQSIREFHAGALDVLSSLAFDALMSDPEKTGRLDETLVVVAAEFGRSPTITRSNAGREHWPHHYVACSEPTA